MWFAGRYCSAFKTLKMSGLATQFGVMTLATSAAFAISNGSFYLFSGRYTDLSWGQYFARVALYYPPYVSSALLYMVLGYGIMKLVKALPALAARRKEV
jgi:hypothetical protein